MKLQTKVRTQVEQEISVDIELPYYFKEPIGQVIMIESVDRVVSAYTGTTYSCIDVSAFNVTVAQKVQKGTQCTEQEFNQVYETALANIQNLQEA